MATDRILTLRERLIARRRRDRLLTQTRAAVRPAPARVALPAAVSLRHRQADVTRKLIAVIDAGFGRSTAWDDAIAATLRALGWDYEEIGRLFAETARGDQASRS